MSAKDNARTAWKEVTKMVGLDKPEKEEAPASEPAKAQVVEIQPVPVQEKESAVTVVAPKAATVIAAGACISGDISAEGDIIVEGMVNGNVESASRLRCYGSITGNVTAKSIVIAGARILGDLRASEDAAVDSGSVVIGNVDAKDILLDGKLKGNLMIKGMTKLEEHAVLVGDIHTERLSICEGSRFTGSLKMTKSEEVADLFR